MQRTTKQNYRQQRQTKTFQRDNMQRVNAFIAEGTTTVKRVNR